MPTRLPLILAAVLATALAGCTQPDDTTAPTNDLAALEGELSASLQGRYDELGYAFDGVSCPSEAAEVGPGEPFACIARVEDQFVRVRVELDPSGGSSFTTLDLVLTMRATEELVAAEMSAQLNDAVTLACGDPNIRVLPIGSAIRCTATDSGGNDVAALLTVKGPGQTAWELVRQR